MLSLEMSSERVWLVPIQTWCPSEAEAGLGRRDTDFQGFPQCFVPHFLPCIRDFQNSHYLLYTSHLQVLFLVLPSAFRTNVLTPLHAEWDSIGQNIVQVRGRTWFQSWSDFKVPSRAGDLILSQLPEASLPNSHPNLFFLFWLLPDSCLDLLFGILICIWAEMEELFIYLVFGEDGESYTVLCLLLFIFWK